MAAVDQHLDGHTLLFLGDVPEVIRKSIRGNSCTEPGFCSACSHGLVLGALSAALLNINMKAAHYPPFVAPLLLLWVPPLGFHCLEKVQKSNWVRKEAIIKGVTHRLTFGALHCQLLHLRQGATPRGSVSAQTTENTRNDDLGRRWNSFLASATPL